MLARCWTASKPGPKPIGGRRTESQWNWPRRNHSFVNCLRRNDVALKTHGTMAVDWEQRVDMDRLRRERLARVKAMLAKSEMGALLCFDMNNVRYITATHIGTW